MPREYVAQMAGNAATFTTTNPFMQVGSPAATPLQLLGLELTQEASTTSAAVVVTLARRSTTSATGLGTTITPAKIVGGDPAATATALSGISTAAGTLTETTLRWGFNALSGLFWVPVPEQRPVLPVSTFWTLQFIGTPGLTWSCNFYFMELV
jgi:hypothetical protein